MTTTTVLNKYKVNQQNSSFTLINYHDHNIHYHQPRTEFGVKTKNSGNFNRFTKIHYHFKHHTREYFRSVKSVINQVL